MASGKCPRCGKNTLLKQCSNCKTVACTACNGTTQCPSCKKFGVMKPMK